MAPSRIGATQVRLVHREQAVAEHALGGQPEAVAGVAERLGHGGDHADRARVRRRRTGTWWPVRSRGPRGTSGCTASIAREDARRRHDLVALPRVLRVQRHVLDEPHLVPGLPGPPREVDDLVVVRPADHDAVDLDRREAGGLGRPHAGEHLLEGVASASSPRTGAAAASRTRSWRGRCRPRRAVRPAGPGARRSWSGRCRGRVRPRGTSGSGREGRRAPVGSPPVTFRLRTPSRTKIPSTRVSSSNVRISCFGSHASPSAGMQYVQRKLHRSVTEMRRSSAIRPYVSTRGPSRGIVAGCAVMHPAYPHARGAVQASSGSGRRSISAWIASSIESSRFRSRCRGCMVRDIARGSRSGHGDARHGDARRR